MVANQNDTPAEGMTEEGSAESRPEEATADPRETQNESGRTEQSAESGDELDSLRQQVSVLEQRANDATDRMLRAQAELDNVRKRSSRDIENAHKYALDKFVGELLPVLDSLELGINAADNAEDSSALKEGMDLTRKKFADVLQKFGVVVIDPQGEKFNPEQHEAVSMQPREGVESGMVISVMQKGYELNGRLIRPAMVMVSS